MNFADVSFQLALLRVTLVTLAADESNSFQVHCIHMFGQIGSQVKLPVAILALNIFSLMHLVGMVYKLNFGKEALPTNITAVFLSF